MTPKGELLNKMLVLATQKHAGQYDKGGMPYILHPLKVMYYLKTDDEELMWIALAHDLFEDTDTTRAELRALGFTERIIEGISVLTKMPGDHYEQYLSNIKSNADAIRVKLCDIRHNSDIRRLKGIGPKDTARIAKYHQTFVELTQALKENADAL